MIKSMTGFGRSEISEGKRKISVEMKSVNHRYLEAGIKMPKKLNIFEARIRDLLKKYAMFKECFVSSVNFYSSNSRLDKSVIKGVIDNL